MNQTADPPISSFLGAAASYAASIAAVAAWFFFDEYVLGNSNIKLGPGGVAVFMSTLMAIANLSSFLWFPFFFYAFDLGKNPHSFSPVCVGLFSGVFVGLGTIALALTTGMDQFAVLFFGPVFLGLVSLAIVSKWKDLRKKYPQQPESTC